MFMFRTSSKFMRSNVSVKKLHTLVTYVWIGGTGEDMRCKTMTMQKEPQSHDDCVPWNFDGSSTAQSEGHFSDMYLRPTRLFADPFLGGRNKLVMCDVFHDLSFDSQGQPVFEKPALTNHRAASEKVLKKVYDSKPWFAMEQEFTLFEGDGSRPLKWPDHGFPGPQGPYYCAVGADKVFGREVVDETYLKCLAAGINVTGTNAEVMPSQWEFQVGPCLGLDIGDQLWMARFILHRVAEKHNVLANLHPKPVKGDWNGAGCHCNMSTEAMRETGGMKFIEEACEKLRKTHAEHIAAYDPSGGKDNALRLTGRHETASMTEFIWGVANRGASIRIPRQVAAKGKGHLEDRRPSSNCDPYLVIHKLCESILLS